MNSSSHSDTLLEIHNIHKYFGAVQALKGISFDIHWGEVIALVGDNGAGKSTLVKIISGVHAPTSGHFTLDGHVCRFKRPSDALNMGIETVYQHLALIEQLDVADNVFLGRESTTMGFIGRMLGILDRSQMRRATAEALQDLHIKIPAPTMAVRRMSGGQRQAVAIGRAITWSRKLLILDEPTAALGVEETEQVLQMIEKLRDAAHMGIMVISHNMQDVYRIADRIVVLRQGRHVATLRKADTDPQEIVAYITGAKPPLIAQE
jgi:ABC-type sugar transport system ATPase subunit